MYEALDNCFGNVVVEPVDRDLLLAMSPLPNSSAARIAYAFELLRWAEDLLRAAERKNEFGILVGLNEDAVAMALAKTSLAVSHLGASVKVIRAAAAISVSPPLDSELADPNV